MTTSRDMTTTKYITSIKETTKPTTKGMATTTKGMTTTTKAMATTTTSISTTEDMTTGDSMTTTEGQTLITTSYIGEAELYILCKNYILS